MSDDIIKQAELRHRMRPAGRVGEAAALFDDSELLSKTKDVSPRQKNVFFSEATLISMDTAMKDTSNQKQFDCDIHRLNAYQAYTLPFVECKVNDVDAKALISTCCKKSLLSKSMYHSLRLSDTRLDSVNASVFLQEHRFDQNFEVRDDIPDLVLGLDFLNNFGCLLNFKEMTFIVDRFSIEVPFMEKTDIPLKFRVHRNLAASF